MSAADGGTTREPGAVPIEGDPLAQPTRVEAEARAEEIHAEVARTEVRRAEDEAAQADEAVKEAERKSQAAHEAEQRARSHAQEVSRDAEDAADRASGSLSRRGTGAWTAPAADGGDPIVFGPFTAERPELLVVAAFVGGFLLAKIIRGIAS